MATDMVAIDLMVHIVSMVHVRNQIRRMAMVPLMVVFGAVVKIRVERISEIMLNVRIMNRSTASVSNMGSDNMKEPIILQLPSNLPIIAIEKFLNEHELTIQWVRVGEYKAAPMDDKDIDDE